MSKLRNVPESDIKSKGTEEQPIENNVSALKILAKLKLDHYLQYYPNVPISALPPITFSDKSSNGLTKCIIDFLRLNDHQAERISVEGRVIDNRKTVVNALGAAKVIGSIKRIKSSMQKGTADVSATVFGRSVKVEVKIGKDTQSGDQKRYQIQVEKAGGVYVVAKSFDGFYQWYLTFREEVKCG